MPGGTDGSRAIRRKSPSSWGAARRSHASRAGIYKKKKESMQKFGSSSQRPNLFHRLIIGQMLQHVCKQSQVLAHNVGIVQLHLQRERKMKNKKIPRNIFCHKPHPILQSALDPATLDSPTAKGRNLQQADISSPPESQKQQPAQTSKWI
jgi:hypothetical protein